MSRAASARPLPRDALAAVIPTACDHLTFGARMPLQNRVDPHGTLFRSPARGTFMGNRGGALHNEQREIVRSCVNRRWITCVLNFKGRHRTVMTPRRYTELFFLDEAVAFAAGHRPCAECRRERFHAFQSAWTHPGGVVVRADEMDAELHRARLDSQGKKRTYDAPLRSLPNGCFILTGQAAYLVWKDALYLWTPERYASKASRPKALNVTVLTPHPAVECFRNGYQPVLHDSVRAFS